MSHSQITKFALARSLKKLMLSYPLPKITIRQLTADCGVTRITFYNHFHDIYELLGWVYQTEIIKGLEEYRNCAGWKEGFLKVLNYIQINKTICQNTFHSLGREHLEKFLYSVIYDVMIEIINELGQPLDLQPQAKEEIADFYTLALLEQVIQWMRAGAHTDPMELVCKVGRLMDGSILRSMENYQQSVHH
ncbi:TetR family transcriptional regulator [Paenibacillus albidus]|uniref:TetR family transcriptional regulator n=1 Tax=Paenibacillus albidus TaxID=2041023 RepID=A0A917FGR8_9BACL|nr:TetR-like C-terminal domain-containing protein [Paenibacillus albidus]GGF76090.1 TetR family transcriptional regulator [Paenibacillus albidus]